MLNKIKNLVSEEKGQGMTEYGLLLAVVVVVIVAFIATFKTDLSGLLDKVTNALESAITSAS